MRHDALRYRRILAPAVPQMQVAARVPTMAGHARDCEATAPRGCHAFTAVCAVARRGGLRDLPGVQRSVHCCTLCKGVPASPHGQGWL
jgi:hypothetical protein